MTQEPDHFQFANDVAPMIPREKMPQIDEKFYADLLVFLGSRGISFTAGFIEPDKVFSHQIVDVNRAVVMSKECLAKPVLLSKDRCILDGNHRWYKHKTDGSSVPFIGIETDFFDALNHLFAYPNCYEYGDGKEHPISF
jgi:hypothetical protein